MRVVLFRGIAGGVASEMTRMLLEIATKHGTQADQIYQLIRLGAMR
jgi:hypothetical protein